MKAIEIMAKAYIEAEPCVADWDEMPTKRKEPIFSGMRAALLALAEAELDEPMINAGWEDDHGTDDFDRDFRRLLRFIAKEGEDNDTRRA